MVADEAALSDGFRHRLRRAEPAAILLAASLVAGFALRAWLATHDDGLNWPDEIYQSLEPAHRVVYGQGLMSWEFIAGARNWLFPGLLAVLLRLLALVGLTDPHGYILAVKLVFCVIGVATIAGCYRLAQAFGATPLAAAVGASLFALMAPAIYFAPRAMSETASALLIVFGLALTFDRRSQRGSFLIGVALVGMSVSFRLQNVILCVALLGILAGRREWRRLGQAALVLAGCGLLMGLIDLATWGSPFHSAITYLRYNLGSGSAQYGISPFGYYLQVSLSAIGPLAAAILFLALIAWRRAPSLVLLAAAYVLAHSLVGHKELRFLLPVMPVLCALAGLGLDVIAETGRRALTRASLAIAMGLALLSAVTFHHLTFSDLGGTVDGGPRISAYDYAGTVNRLLLAAHGRSDMCGIKVESVRLAWTGGYTYLDRSVPLYGWTDADDSSQLYNYVITGDPAGAGRTTVARNGTDVLARLANDSCRPDPSRNGGR